MAAIEVLSSSDRDNKEIDEYYDESNIVVIIVVIVVMIVRIVLKTSHQTSSIILGSLEFLWRHSRKR